jgi:hypothetical protein
MGGINDTIVRSHSDEPPEGVPHEEFSQVKFLKQLVNFIITDDQVCRTTYAINFSH